MTLIALTSLSSPRPEVITATFSPTVMTLAPPRPAWSKVHATADLRTVLPTTTVKSFNQHLQTRSLGSATTMSTLTNSKRQKGPSASSAAMAGWTAKRTRPQLFQSVWQDNGNPLKLYQLSLTHQKFWPYQTPFRNQMMLPRLTAAALSWTWPGRTP